MNSTSADYTPGVRLIAITKPVIDDCTLPGDLIAYCARVSNPANQHNSETAPKLLAYLAREHHWSPFEMASMTVEIKTTRDIARQILRHRSFSFQEFSQRYAEVAADPVPREARMQDSKNRQNSLEATDPFVRDWWLGEQAQVAAITKRSYEMALKAGIAKEVARAVLPEGLTESTLYMAGTIRSFLNYVQERTQPGVQKEHRVIAESVKRILLDSFPALTELLVKGIQESADYNQNAVINTLGKLTPADEAKLHADLIQGVADQRRSGGFLA